MSKILPENYVEKVGYTTKLPNYLLYYFHFCPNITQSQASGGATVPPVSYVVPHPIVANVTSISVPFKQGSDENTCQRIRKATSLESIITIRTRYEDSNRVQGNKLATKLQECLVRLT